MQLWRSWHFWSSATFAWRSDFCHPPLQRQPSYRLSLRIPKGWFQVALGHHLVEIVLENVRNLTEKSLKTHSFLTPSQPVTGAAQPSSFFARMASSERIGSLDPSRPNRPHLHVTGPTGPVVRLWACKVVTSLRLGQVLLLPKGSYGQFVHETNSWEFSNLTRRPHPQMFRVCSWCTPLLNFIHHNIQIILI